MLRCGSTTHKCHRTRKGERNELAGGIPSVRRPCGRQARLDLKNGENLGGLGVVGNEDANLQALSGSRQPPEGNTRA